MAFTCFMMGDDLDHLKDKTSRLYTFLFNTFIVFIHSFNALSDKLQGVVIVMIAYETHSICIVSKVLATSVQIP